MLRRLRPLDRVLVLILVPLWVVCFGLALRTQFRGESIPYVEVSLEDVESHPTLTGYFARYPSDPLARAGLRAGDRLIRVGDADLRGVGCLGFQARASREAGRDLSVPLVFERDGERRETSLALVPMSVFRPGLAPSLAAAVSGLLLLLRARPTPSVRSFFYMMMCAALLWTSLSQSPAESLFPWFVVLAVVTAALFFPMLFRFVSLFPDDRASEGRWHRIWPWFFAPPMGLAVALDLTGQMAVGRAGLLSTVALGLVAGLAVLTRKYRWADQVARRQMKWGLFGAWCGGLPIALAGGLAALFPRLGWLVLPSAWALPLFPLFLFVSVVRFNLFDIDRILSAAASYNILAVVLAAGALVVVPRIAEAASGWIGIDPGTGQVALSLALAAILVPAHRRLRPQIDRVFFKERYALDHGIAELLPTLSGCVDVRELTERVGEGLNRLLRPDGCVVYALVGESYVPVFAEGRAVPPAFEATSPLVGTLGDRRKPLALGNAGRRPDEAPLGPFDRAALETLGAEVVVPVRRDDALAAFVCLGPKRSGDVYTSTDISQLASVAETVSLQLQRFDQAETVREAREMQESLRRYVPGAIAEQLSSGAELVSGEREVSVLFVDIRGYTTFSESRQAGEIFSTINRYTETVSEIVRKHGGSVVEFNGDGMMTVFGAPRELAHKERAAVEAGREIADAVAALPVEAGEGGETNLSVGVGIATGEAFVGNIQAVDRMIWTAIGNTTNLAARLQGLTRDLDAAMVIDLATWRAAGEPHEFERRDQVAIRGRSQREDLCVLRLG